MSILPDELWTKIMEQGLSTSQLNHRDLCTISITCRRLRRLSAIPSLWSTLLSLHFPSSSSSPTPPSKSLYRLRFERDKARRVAAWNREVLIAESNVAASRKRLGELKGKILMESERLRDAAMDLSNLERLRRASVALNVWQPEVVRGSHNQIVEQCTVPIEAKLSSLRSEISLCKKQIAIFDKAYNDQKEMLRQGKEALKSLKYHPLNSYQPGSTANANDHHNKMKRKRASKAPILSISDEFV